MQSIPVAKPQNMWNSNICIEYTVTHSVLYVDMSDFMTTHDVDIQEKNSDIGFGA